MSKLVLASFVLFTLITSFGLAFMYPAIGSLFYRDQGYVNATTIQGAPFHRLFPYLNYPFEYPWLGGVLMFLVNAVSYFAGWPGGALLVSIYWSSLMMGLFAAGTYVLLHRMGASLKKIAVFFAFSPLIFLSYDVPFDLAAVFFSVLCLYFLSRKKEGASAGALALAIAVKGFPLVLLFGVLKDVKHKVRYLTISLGSFLAGLAVQYSISPENFLRAGSYLTGYGVEGSWLGLAFGHIIDYLHVTTWTIGSSTQLHLPQPFQVLSLGLIAVSGVLLYRSRLSVPLKCFLAFASVVLFWWWSPPQFLFYVFALLPLVADLDWKTVLMTEGMTVPALFPVWARVPVPISSEGWVLISAVYQGVLALYIVALLLPRVVVRAAEHAEAHPGLRVEGHGILDGQDLPDEVRNDGQRPRPVEPDVQDGDGGKRDGQVRQRGPDRNDAVRRPLARPDR